MAVDPGAFERSIGVCVGASYDGQELLELATGAVVSAPLFESQAPIGGLCVGFGVKTVERARDSIAGRTNIPEEGDHGLLFAETAQQVTGAASRRGTVPDPPGDGPNVPFVDHEAKLAGATALTKKPVELGPVPSKTNRLRLVRADPHRRKIQWLRGTRRNRFECRSTGPIGWR
jgi:hypothetical protein